MTVENLEDAEQNERAKKIVKLTILQRLLLVPMFTVFAASIYTGWPIVKSGFLTAFLRSKHKAEMAPLAPKEGEVLTDEKFHLIDAKYSELENETLVSEQSLLGVNYIYHICSLNDEGFALSLKSYLKNKIPNECGIGLITQRTAEMADGKLKDEVTKDLFNYLKTKVSVKEPALGR